MKDRKFKSNNLNSQWHNRSYKKIYCSSPQNTTKAGKNLTSPINYPKEETVRLNPEAQFPLTNT